MRSDVSKWADEAMFPAAPLAEEGEEPKVTVQVITMTPNPLRVMAAASELYTGRPCTPDDIDRETALQWLAGFKASKISAPLEWIQIALLVEGVSRDFTHQMVRQRTATFVQESMRFAVKDNAANEVPTPPSIAVLREDDPVRVIWREHIERTGWVYNALINGGIPAEDARKGLLIGTATRLHYRTDLRNLVDHSGMRLCSQAQFEWKQFWLEAIKAIMNYGPKEHRWQQKAICSLFAPICFQTGKCEFMSHIDRYCVIRDRVEAHHRAGDPVSTWTDIHPHEPLHPEAARHA